MITVASFFKLCVEADALDAFLEASVLVRSTRFPPPRDVDNQCISMRTKPARNRKPRAVAASYGTEQQPQSLREPYMKRCRHVRICETVTDFEPRSCHAA